MRERFCLVRSRSAAFMHSHLKELHGRRSSDDQHTSDLRGLANPRPCRLDFSTEAALSALRSSGPGQRARPPPRVVRRLLARIHRHLSAGADTRWAWAGVLQGATARVCLSREGSQCQASHPSRGAPTSPSSGPHYQLACRPSAEEERAAQEMVETAGSCVLLKPLASEGARARARSRRSAPTSQQGGDARRPRRRGRRPRAAAAATPA